jgi:hypothetical protein
MNAPADFEDRATHSPNDLFVVASLPRLARGCLSGPWVTAGRSLSADYAAPLRRFSA